MGNDGSPRPGYDRWVSFDGHGKLFDPELNVDGRRRAAPGYVTDVLNAEAVAFVPDALVLALDIAPTMIALAGGTPGSHVQGRSLVPLLGGRRPADRRTSFLVEYWSENAMPWLVGMTYKAVRTERAKLIHWVNRDGVDEFYDLAADPYELANLIDDPARAREREDLRRELARLVVEALGL
jgi:arylsulfatase A-like enzyme